MANGKLYHLKYKYKDDDYGSWHNAAASFPCSAESTGITAYAPDNEGIQNSGANIILACDEDPKRPGFTELDRYGSRYSELSLTSDPCNSELECGEFYHPDAPAVKAVDPPPPSPSLPPPSNAPSQSPGPSKQDTSSNISASPSPALLIGAVAAVAVVAFLILRR